MDSLPRILKRKRRRDGRPRGRTLRFGLKIPTGASQKPSTSPVSDRQEIHSPLDPFLPIFPFGLAIIDARKVKLEKLN
ncbi:unnamed protein product [Victoria cruziana]